MPRVVFNSVERGGLLEWMDRFCKDGKYTAYFTTNMECVLEPTRSTSPIRYGYIDKLVPSEVELITKKCNDYGVPIFYIKMYEWASDRSVGVNTTRY